MNFLPKIHVGVLDTTNNAHQESGVAYMTRKEQYEFFFGENQLKGTKQINSIKEKVCFSYWGASSPN